ncbi:MAG: ComEC/Rec2 family competence protein [Clostridia bacterium]|nr:ComEC/Rec2 family competence protein [Clostridia bacterium]
MKKFKTLKVVSFFLLFFSLLLFINFSKYQKIETKYNEKTAEITARIESISANKEEEAKNQKYLITVIKVNDKKTKFKSVLTSKNLVNAKIGEVIKFKSKFYSTTKNSDFYKNNFSKGIVFTFYPKENDIEVIKREKSLIYLLKNNNLKFIKELKNNLPNEEGAVAIAMLLGDKSLLSRNLYSVFQKTGVAHLFSISGLHMSLIAFSTYKFLLYITKSNKISSYTAIVFIIFFSFMTQMQPSVLRSGIMMIFVFLSKILQKTPDILNSLGISLFLILFIKPQMALNLSLLLSAFSTIGIISINPIITSLFKVKNRIISKIISYISIWFSSAVSTILINAFIFKRLYLTAPISNMAVLFFASISLIINFLSFIIFFFPFVKIYFPYFALTMGMINHYIIWILKKISTLKILIIDISGKEFLFLLLVLIIFLTFSIIFKNKKEKIAVYLCIILSFHLISTGIINRNEKILNIPDIGNASLITLSYNHNLYMFSAGGAPFNMNKIFDIIDENQINDYKLLFIPRNEKTENESFIEYKMNLPFDDIKEVSKKEQISSGKITLSDDLICDFYSSTENAYIYFNISGVTVLWTMLPGADFNSIPKNHQKADILISRAKPPRNTNLSYFRDIIICDDEERANRTISKLNYPMIKTTPKGLKIRINYDKYRIYRK